MKLKYNRNKTAFYFSLRILEFKTQRNAKNSRETFQLFQKFCILTSPTSETFHCFVSRIVRRLKQNNFLDSKRNLFYCFISVL